MPKKPQPPLTEAELRHLEESEHFKMKGKHEKALEIAERLLRKNPSCVEAAEEVADNFFSMGNMERAVRAAQYAVKLAPKSAIGNFILGVNAVEAQDWEDAVKLLRLSNAGEPNNVEVLRSLGWAIFFGGQQAEGIAVLRRAVALADDGDATVLVDLGVCLVQTGAAQEGKNLFLRAEKEDPDNPRVAELLGALRETHPDLFPNPS